jgi:hypothetical protein
MSASLGAGNCFPRRNEAIGAEFAPLHLAKSRVKPCQRYSLITEFDQAQARLAHLQLTFGTCNNYFALWKDAYADIPILKEAKAEHRSCSSGLGYPHRFVWTLKILHSTPSSCSTRQI